MKKLALVKDGVISNIISGDAFPGYVQVSDDVQIGWLVDGDAYSPPPSADPEPLDINVSNAQARVALKNAGLFDDVEAAIAAMPEGQQKVAAETGWNHSPTLSRQGQFVQALGVSMGLSDHQLDDLFKQAAMIRL